MATASRPPHWVPQYYLKGFARNPSKNAQLYIVDAVKDKAFMTTPRNVASERDFNRIDVDGIFPLVMCGQFEGLFGVQDFGLDAVARINTDVIAHALGQMYARDDCFRYAIRHGGLRTGADLLRDLSLLQERVT